MPSIPTNNINHIGRSTFQESLKDWELLRTARVNALLVGGPYETTAALAALHPYLDAPVCILRARWLALPAPEHGGSLIVADVCHLTAEEQLRLLDWIETNDGRTRIISTSPRQMGGMLARGMFLEALYYRLNTVHIDILAD